MKRLKGIILSVLVIISPFLVTAQVVWQNLASLDSFAVQAITSVDEILLIGMYGGGMQRSLDGGVTWEASNEGTTSYFIQGFAQSDDTVFALSKEKGVFASSDQGQTWQGLNTHPLHRESFSIAFHRGKLYVGSYGGLTFSEDFGQTWTAFDLPPSVSSYNDILSILAVNETLLATTTRAIFLSLDEGQTWQAVLVSDAENITSAYHNGQFYIGTSGDGLYRSDNGLDWKKISGALPRQQQLFRAILFVEEELFTSVSGARFLKDLEAYLDDSPPSTITALAYHGSSIYAGTADDGMWKIGLENPLSDKEIFSLEIQPTITDGNQITVTYKLVQDSPVQIRLLDQNGKQVATLLNGSQTRGDYRITFEIGDIETGHYFVQLLNTKERVTKPIVIMH